MTEKILLKDLLFNDRKILLISGQIKKIYPQFNADQFCAGVSLEMQKLELKQRIALIANFLKNYLPRDYKTALKILLDSLPKPLNEDLCDNDFGDFIYASFSEFVAQNGCNKENLAISLAALREITKRFSSEYAIRNFLNKFPKESLEFLQKCSLDKNYHVRRLASEGLRPSLPWGKKITISYKEAAKVLENLYCDKTRFVTRSTANHLNDISKIDPDFVIATLKRWKKTKKQSPKELDFINKHALRTLIKQGNQAALTMLGFNHKTKIILSDFVISKEVVLNENLHFSFAIKSGENANLVLDYVVYFCNQNNSLRKGKVFKLKSFIIKKNQIFSISKKHAMTRHLTTRTLHNGRCALEIRANGAPLKVAHFFLINEKS